jgi:hypothetical protein
MFAELADFCMRLAAGMLLCLLLLSPVRTARPAPGQKPLANPTFFRTHFLTALALACGALLLLWGEGGWYLLALLGGAVVLACLGSVSWSLERSPGGVTLVVLTAAVLLVALVIRETTRHTPAGLAPPLPQRLAGSLSSALLLGAALSAMLMGHSYLTAPAMSLTPLYRLLAAVAVTLLVRLGVEVYALVCWTSEHGLAKLEEDMLLWLPLRWLVGFLAPGLLCWLAYLTARIRSTQSATGILYVVVIFCFLGELTGQLLAL